MTLTTDMSSPLDQVSAVLEEAIKETVGRSSKKWALVLVAFVVGATAAFWLIRQARSASTVDPIDVEAA